MHDNAYSCFGMRALLISALVLVWVSYLLGTVFWIAGLQHVGFGFHVLTFLTMVMMPVILTIKSGEWKAIAIFYAAAIIISLVALSASIPFSEDVAVVVNMFVWLFASYKMASVLLRNSPNLNYISTATLISVFWPLMLVPYLVFVDVKE
nr:hypothetical protein [Hyphomonas sp. Mor2]